jgi:hypothetical protein
VALYGENKRGIRKEKEKKKMKMEMKQKLHAWGHEN